MQYCYSDNEELFTGRAATLEGALSEALDAYPDADTLWIGTAKQKTISAYFGSAEDILEDLAERAGEECGEAAENWLSFPCCGSRRTKEGETREEYDQRVEEWRKKKAGWLAPLDEAIEAALEKWATDNDEQPGFYHVESAKCYTREEAEAILAEPHH